MFLQKLVCGKYFLTQNLLKLGIKRMTMGVIVLNYELTQRNSYCQFFCEFYPDNKMNTINKKSSQITYISIPFRMYRFFTLFFKFDQ